MIAMDNLGNVAKRVVWREGTLLMPQHLQHQTRHLEALAHQRVNLTQPFAWGLASLALDKDQIEQGKLCIRSVLAWMPDGTLVSRQDQDALNLVRSFEEHFGPETQELEVGIAVPPATLGNSQIHSLDAPNPRARYVSQKLELHDESAQGKSCEIELASPQIQILLGKEFSDAPNALPVTRILREQGKFRLDTGFIGPCLNLRASPGLEIRLRALVAHATEQRRDLLAQRPLNTPQQLRMSPQTIEIHFALQALSVALAGVQSMLKSGATAPYQIYLELIRWAASLECVQAQALETLDVAYQHHRAHQCFIPLFERLTLLIGNLARKHFESLALNRRSDGMWLGTLDTFHLSAQSTYVIGIQCDNEQECALERIPALAKLASYRQISSVIDAAISGAKLEALRRPPRELPDRHNWIYFRVIQDNHYWQDIIQERNLALYVGDAYAAPQTQIELYCIPSLDTQPHPLAQIAS